MPNSITPFSAIYELFLGKITADMYMELSPEETQGLLKELLKSAVHWFEFPRFDLYAFNEEGFTSQLTHEEQNILATYMVVEWLGQQLASVEIVRMKYSGSDFKMTSQANHMSRLISLKKEYERIGFHLQRLYKRRKRGEDGVIHSTFGSIMGKK